MKTIPKVHLIDARHAHREGDMSACPSTGTQRVVPECAIDAVTCRACIRWYENQPVELSAQGRALVDSLP